MTDPSGNEYESVRHLSYEETQHGWSSDYPAAEPEEPTVALVDTENELELEIPAGAGLTYIYSEPLDWESRFAVDEWGMSTGEEDPSFMQVSDMEALWDRTEQGVVGSKTNKIVMATGTDPALYDIDEWDPALARYELILRRHDSMPAERAGDADDMTIINASFDDVGIFKVEISDQGWLFRANKFGIPPGDYKILVTGSHRRRKNETVTIDMWPSDQADDTDEVVKAAEWM